MPKIGVMLSGCGVFDGSEIHESVLTLLAIARHGGEAVCMAPDMEQAEVINHATKKPVKEARNVLVESARIARGSIRDLKGVKAGEIDAVILPGGYGAAKNLCTYAFDGEDCKVHPEVERFVKEVRAAGKPIGAICISPVLVAKIFQGDRLLLTIGKDAETATAIKHMGHDHRECEVQNICVDEKQKVVTTPAYMLAQSILEAHEGIDKLVSQIMKLIS